jgi:hypothetical protein
VKVCAQEGKPPTRKYFQDKAALAPLQRATAFAAGQLLVRCSRLCLDAHALVLGAAGWALERCCFGHVTGGGLINALIA